MRALIDGRESSKKLDATALLGALSLFLSTLEYLIPKPLPFIRLGLANLPILIALFLLPPKFIFLLIGLKILGQGLVNGTLFSYSVMAGPNNPLSHYAAGQHYGKAGIRDQKLKFYASSLELFMARKDQENLFEERSRDAFSVTATEIAFSELNRNPQKAIELAEVAIEQFHELATLRDGRIDTNVAAPYYVKALAFKNLGDIENSIQTCRTALAITYHRGIDQLLRSLKAVP